MEMKLLEDSQTDEKVRENRLRRLARRQGLVLRKSRGHLHLNNLGGYMVVDVDKNIIRAGQRFDWNLDDVQHYLDERMERYSRDLEHLPRSRGGL